MTLEFRLKDNILQRSEAPRISVVSSKGSIRIHFSIPEEYTGTITAHFASRCNNEWVKELINVDNVTHMCEVPSNIARNGGFYISLIIACDNYITTNSLWVDLSETEINIADKLKYDECNKADRQNEVDHSFSFISPYKIYTVCNDIISSKKGHNRNYGAAIYLDHLFSGLSEEKDIKFTLTKSDHVVFHSPIEVIDANEENPSVRYNNGVNILEVTKNIKISGSDRKESSFDVIHASVLNSATKTVTPRVLCIGDSITYAELAQVNDDNHTQNWGYHLMCKEFFIKDRIDNGNEDYDCLFLGQYKKQRIMNYNSREYIVTTHHEGIRGISLSSYLNGDVSAFRSEITGKFSILEWLAKYRTMDEQGNRLTLGNGTGTLVTSDNLAEIDVCTPTHVLIMLGANGGGTLEQYRELVGIIQMELPNLMIGITIPDAAGTYFPSLHPNCSDQMVIWNDTGSQGSRHTQQYELVKMLQAEYGNENSENNNVYFLPFYFVQPTAESCSMRRVDLPDASIQLTAHHTFNDSYGWHASTHVNGIGHINWGYQLYAWLKYTIAKYMS
ncbi:MAG: hypothetical protein K0S47_4292 [Herbinix sp.]|jgi:hypothetical protein|nr:hypothetical protein [Herbinix sp.]